LKREENGGFMAPFTDINDVDIEKNSGCFES
jgi:hypothetical protein